MNLAALGTDDLEKLELDQIPDTGDVVIPEPEAGDEPPEVDSVDGADSDDTSEPDTNQPEVGEPIVDPDKTPVEGPEEKPEPKVNKNGEPIEGDPLKDTKAWATKLAEENKKLKAELEERRRKELSHGLEDFEVLTDEEFAELADEDPVAARDYMRRETVYNQRHEQIKQLDDQKARAAQDEIYNRTVANVTDFASKIGIKQQDFDKFVDSPEFIGLTKYVAENFKPGDNGVYSADQLLRAHKYLNYEKEVAKAIATGRSRAVNDIVNAQRTGSRLDRMPGGGTIDSTRPRKLEQLSQDEILRMSDAQLNAYMAELD